MSTVRRGVGFRTIGRGGGIALLACGLLGRPAAAQTLGAQLVRASSPNAELPDPRGFALTGLFPTRGWLFRIDFVHFTDATQKPGLVCLAPGYGCSPEEVASRVRMAGLHLDLARSIALGWPLSITAGGGVSFSSVRVSAEGVSGRRAFVYSPNDGSLGFLGLLSMEVTPVPDFPLRLLATWEAHWVAFRGCTNPNESTAGYAPFCGTQRFQEAMIGLSWDLSAVMGG